MTMNNDEARRTIESLNAVGSPVERQVRPGGETRGTMSDFYNPPEARKARKPHQCTYCAEPIATGDWYTFQKGNYDGRWYENKMHPECFEDMCDGDGEFTPYSNERPRVEA